MPPTRARARSSIASKGITSAIGRAPRSLSA
jgi:hypothetical protein